MVFPKNLKKIKKWAIEFYNQYGFYPIAGADFGGDIPEANVPTVGGISQSAFDALNALFPGQLSALAGGQRQGIQNLQSLFGIGQDFFKDFGVGSFAQPIDREFFQSFAPTSFEQGIAESPFGELIDQAQRQALQIGSLSGLPSTAPGRFTRAISPALINIGQFLGGQQQNQALASIGQQQFQEQLALNQALNTLGTRQFAAGTQAGLDPFSPLNPFLGIAQQQGNLQSQLDLESELLRQEQEAAGFRTIGSVFGLPGTIFGGVQGGTSGALSGAQGQLDTFQMLFGGGGGGGTGGGGGSSPFSGFLGGGRGGLGSSQGFGRGGLQTSITPFNPSQFNLFGGQQQGLSGLFGQGGFGGFGGGGFGGGTLPVF